jgi:hypothetical protein
MTYETLKQLSDEGIITDLQQIDVLRDSIVWVFKVAGIRGRAMGSVDLGYIFVSMEGGRHNSELMLRAIANGSKEEQI